MQIHNARTFALMLGLTVFSTAAISLNWGILRTVGAALLIFILPGYALLSVWFPERMTSPAARTLFILIMSVTITGLGGLVLHLTLGLYTETWLIWLTAITVIHSGIAFWRGERRLILSEAEPYSGFHWGQIALISIGVLVAFGAIMLARNGVIEQGRTGFTQLWMLPDENTPNTRALIGIHNQENEDIVYRLVLSAGGQVITEENVIVESNQVWQSWLPLSPETVQPIHAQLYRLDHPREIYRSALLWLTPPD